MSPIHILSILIAYAIGSISFARVVAGRRIPGEEITTTEVHVEGTAETWVYRGVSATSLIPRAGARWALLVIVLDALKALIPTLAARLAWPDEPIYLAVALAVVVGHVWPLWHGFRGGRGQSSILGALLVIDVLSIPFAVVVGAIVGLLVFTSVYAARNGSAFYLPIWFLMADGPGPELAFSFLLVLVYLAAIRPDIREELSVRLASGVSSLSWQRRLKMATTDFFSMKDA